MTDRLPPNLLALFAPRPPLRWVQAPDHPVEARRNCTITGIGACLPALEAYKATDKYEPTESWLQARDRKKLEQKKGAGGEDDVPANYKPEEDPNIRGDPFRTLMVARLSYDANQHDLESEFGRFGPIERIKLIVDTHTHLRPNKKKRPHRGYAFVVFEREKDMRAALDRLDGIRIKDRRIKVDVMRAKTVKGWKPRRLGGGLGGRGYIKAASSRAPGPGFGGGGVGFRGGFSGRGGFDGPRRGGFRGGFGGRGGGRGGFDGPRGGDFGGAGFGGAPSNAPSGPGGATRSGYGGGYRDGPGRSFDDRPGGRDGGRFGDRDRGEFDRDRRSANPNLEPFRPRESRDRGDPPRDAGGHRDRGGDYRSSRDDRPPRDDRPSRDDRPPRDDRSFRDDDRRHDDRKRTYDGSGYDSERKLRRY